MHPTSMTTTPFSVKDILKLEHHHDFENEFLMTDQVVPMNYEHVHAACVSGMQEKLHIHNSAAEEEINEQGETMRTHFSAVGRSGLGRTTQNSLFKNVSGNLTI